MRSLRLKADMRRADKEIQFYQDRSDLAQKISKIEERRNKKKESSDDEQEVEDKFKVRRQKNIEKIVKYHQRKRRDFKQHEPILED